MDRFSLKKLEFHRVKEMLGRHCSTSLGRAYVQDLEPSTEAEEILRLQEETSEACDALRMYPDITMEGVQDVAPLLRRALIGGVLEPVELLSLYELLKAARRLKRIFARQEIELPLLEGRVMRLEECSTLQERIAVCIEPDGEIADHASPELAKQRHNGVLYLANIPGLLETGGCSHEFIEERTFLVDEAPKTRCPLQDHQVEKKSLFNGDANKR
jgi:DNA mismatch repair protein MutS2